VRAVFYFLVQMINTTLIDSTAPAFSWSGVFSNALNKAVDTASQIAISRADDKQQAVTNPEKTAVPVAVAPVNGAAPIDWKRVGIYAGVGVAALLTVMLIRKAAK
jgi:hypothetical protein